MTKIYSYMTAIFLIALFSCKKLVDVPPPFTSLNNENVYQSDNSAIAVLNDIFSTLSSGGAISGLQGISLLTGLSGDEFSLSSSVTDPVYQSYYKNNLSSIDGNGVKTFWQYFYRVIFKCNSAIEGVSQSPSLSVSVKQQLLGEAKFTRALCYFYLVNLFGKVPVVESTDYQTSVLLPRAEVAAVYEYIIADLTECEKLLSVTFLDGSLNAYQSFAERVRPTSWAAAALLSRVYLYINRYEDAEIQSSKLIDNSNLFSLVNLDEVFVKNSSEAIWQLQPVVVGHNTEEAQAFILPESGPSDVSFGTGNPVYLSSKLVSSFESDDIRRIQWIDSVTVDTSTYYFPFKYKIATLGAPVTEYLMVFRLAEQFLIRAEARVHRGNTSGALEDLNIIRNRAGLPNSDLSSSEAVLFAIEHERRIELFTEWGNRWLDLKRTGSIDSTMNEVSVLKGADWVTTDQLFPIPNDEIKKAPALTQNEGY